MASVPALLGIGGMASDDTGILIAPATGRRRDVSRASTAGGRSWLWRILPWTLGIAILGGGGFTAHRLLAAEQDADDPVAVARAEAAQHKQAASDATARALALEAELASVRTEAAALAAEKQQLAAKVAESAALEKKLAAAVGDGGSVTRDGEEIRLELVDKVLFKLGEAELTPRGEFVLYNVGEALQGVPDKQIWVQGHTDDTPIKPAKGVVPRFASNWELSAARALTVVHYLEEEARLDPRRLAAVAFGQHRPASRVKAKNRRIEIVLYPKHVLVRR